MATIPVVSINGWGVARVPVPWGPEPKAQFVSDRKRKKFSWRGEPVRKELKLDFEGLLSDSEVTSLYKTLISSFSRPARSHGFTPASPKWAIIKASRTETKRRRSRPEVSSLDSIKAAWVDQSGLSLDELAIQRAIDRGESLEASALDPFSTRSKVSSVDQNRQEWSDLLPPSLLAWAVEKGIKRESAKLRSPQDPFKTRSNVISLEERRQIAAALKRGEWCKVDELDVLPRNLREWLIECRVRLIRFIGGAGISGTPVNGYVTEDGTVFYVAEDGSTFYVQET